MNKLGFGFLRFPMRDTGIDYEEVNAMVDEFIARGGTYFDTAYTYLEGRSEEAIRECVVKRYPRDAFRLATKMPGYYAKSCEDCRRYFDESAKRCGVEYFDVFMLHWLNKEHYALAEKYEEFRFLQEIKAEGKAKKIGFSFHDTAELLDQILTDHPEVDCVLLQINYLDWDSPGIQSRLCYETALRHGKEIIVMEPVKGGTLAKVPDAAADLLAKIDPNASPAFHAIRFVQSLPGVATVLSGMGSLAQMQENLQPVQPMSQQELALMEEAAHIIRNATAIPCTGCGYCLTHCPMEIPIPKFFSLYNEYALYPRHLWKITPAYEKLALAHPRASACIGCRSCESHCPQKLPIPEHMAAVAEEFDK